MQDVVLTLTHLNSFCTITNILIYSHSKLYTKAEIKNFKGKSR